MVTLDEYLEIQELARQGLSKAEIALQLGLDRKTVRKYLSLAYSTLVVPDVTTDNEPCYMAYHPELEGCMTHGSTLEEALHNLEEVTELYISALLDKGVQMPHPQ